jgi:uncharacterized protein (DUF302 family)
MATAAYGIGKLVERPFDETVANVRDALREQGFGVMCEIDVQAAMKEREIGLLLPCNVIVYEAQGGTKVSAIDAELMLGFVGNPGLSAVAVEVGERLRSVIENV